MNTAAESQPEIAFLNGRETAIESGETILDAARRLRLEIPTLCHDERLKPLGGCRLCLVHCEGRDRPVAACHTPLEPGMNIQTHTPEIEELRQSLLALVLETAAHSGLDPHAIGEGPFAELVKRYQPDVSAPAGKPPVVIRDRSHPVLEYTASACIGCRLCLSACGALQDESVFALDGRGATARVRLVGGRSFRESPCEACGACVDLCPTGALLDRDRRQPLESGVRMTDTVCGFCSIGCQIEVASVDGEIRQITGIPDAAVNRGHLCQKGRYRHTFAQGWDRITKPMMRDGAGFREVDWKDAITFISERIADVVNKLGPDAFGAIASTRATNEANYLLQKFCRTIVGTNNIDSDARSCHMASARILHAANGFGAGMTSFDAIEKAHCFVIAGANPTVSHPVLGARIRQAVRRGARLIVIDPMATELARKADLFLQPVPGTDATLLNGLAHELVEHRWVNLGAVGTHAEGATRLRGILSRYPRKKVADHCDVPEEALSALAESLAEFGKRSLFLYGTGLTQQSGGTAAVKSFYNLAVLCGAVGHGNEGGFASLGGEANLQGALDTGCLPEWLPGHRPVDDSAVWPHFRMQWGADPPESPGLNGRQMLEAAREGRLSALWVMGHDFFENQPDEALAQEALKPLNLLVVQDMYYSEHCRHADIILPEANFFEQDGVLTNAERRIQLIRQAVEPPGEVRPDWAAIALVARRLGAEWPYQDAEEIFAEIAQVIPDLMGGISHSRLEDELDGLQWPCPDPAHPGTADLRFEDLPDSRTRLFTENTTPYPERETAGFPCILITGRQPEDSNTLDSSRKSPSVGVKNSEFLRIHPSDGKWAGIASGARVKVESPSGKIEVAAFFSEHIRPGTVLLTGRSPHVLASRLAGEPADPAGGSPALNGIPIRMAPATPKKTATESSPSEG